ncbi:MAG: Nitroreductase [Candidatus Methanohalarchaeum thermophilum]|uniref:Nitroreductase n=1 Tax=Methanohalarchaeum thermophilum TaxID=1903181 RepID=A0A1Q6DSY7_METT1|nr:MAG: Nitroreductase [Candidatus Methanohalarchaeum thermophilum]
MIESIRERRSVRSFSDDGVEEKKIEEILTAAAFSPSARALYPWSITVVENPEKREVISKATPYADFAAEAPVVFVVASKEEGEWIEDASIVAEHIQLEATNQGLGACWIQIRDHKTEDDKQSEEKIKDLLEIPEDYRVLCAIAIGHPKKQKQPHTKKELQKREIYRKKHGNKPKKQNKK